MNGRLVRKPLGFSIKLEMLTAVCICEDVIYNLDRRVRALAIEVNETQRRRLYRSPAMAAGLTDHIWSIEELLTLVPIPDNTY